mgnify:FL=1
MDKRVILAVAGAGKTYTLCKNVDANKRNIILAFTNQNIKNISKELNENHDETIENTYVYTFDSFKYNFFIRPYEPIIAKHFGITTFESKGISLVTPPPRFKNNFPNPDYKDSSLFEHYVIKDKYYCDNLSELILKVKKKGEYNLFDIAMKNINNFFECIYIDEFQDFRQHDYELMEKVIKKSKNIVLVGDYFQHSVNARNNTGKPFKVGNSKETKRIITYEEYIELLKKLNLKIDTESLKRTRRCPENICKFIREKFNIQIYADNENKGDITFLEDINEIKKVIENNDIIKLVESDSKIYSFNCINWGYSKGDTYNDICVILTDRFKNFKKEKNIEYTSIVNKIYVALTRTKGNLYIIEKEKFDDIKYNYIKN